MLASAAEQLPSVRLMCDKASEILGYDLLDVCVNGPKEKLDDTAFAQPALFVAGLAAVEKLRAESPETVASCSRVAGLSLGEYTALVFAGAMSFEDGLRVVQCRAEAMKAAAAQGDHGMLSVVGLADDVLETCVADARRAVAAKRASSRDSTEGFSKDVVCAVANYLFPTGRVVSGDADALDEVARLATEAGAMKTAKLAVAGAFHTERMAGASEALRTALASVTVSEPRVATYSNVTGTFFESASAIPDALAKQRVSPVRWEDTLRALVAEGKDEMYELGPMKQIKAMARRVSAEVAAKFKNVDVA
jgi:[acyl-carrier-protein] S-malonyltransferase